MKDCFIRSNGFPVTWIYPELYFDNYQLKNQKTQKHILSGPWDKDVRVFLEMGYRVYFPAQRTVAPDKKVWGTQCESQHCFLPGCSKKCGIKKLAERVWSPEFRNICPISIISEHSIEEPCYIHSPRRRQWHPTPVLAWKIPWAEEPGGLQSMGLRRVRDDWVTSLSLFTFLHWRRKWQATPVFLPGESQ